MRLEEDAGFLEACLHLRPEVPSAVQPALSGTTSPVRAAARDLGVYLAFTEAIDSLPLSVVTEGMVDVIDLFSGCGGMSSGFRAVSALYPIYRLAGALDIDEYANETYATNLGLAPKTEDIRKFIDNSGEMSALFQSILGHRTRKPLVLIGCAPCQGFSSHRKKDKREDSRNGLIEVFAKAVVQVKPDFVVMENVPELLSGKHWALFTRFSDTLGQAGYRVRARIVNMAEFGVPQERFRALVIASKMPFLMPRGFLIEGHYRTVRDAIGHLPPLEPGVASPADPIHITARHRTSTIETIQAVPKDGGSRPKGIGPKCLDRISGFSDVYGRLSWDRPAVTVTAYARNPASGRYSHPDQDRGLSVREAALLQGFPQSYVFEGPIDEKFMQVGNAVPPRFAAHLAAHLGGEILAGPPPAEDVDFDMTFDVTSPVSNSFSSVIAGIKSRRSRPDGRR